MANHEEHIDLIERFFEGNLNESEQQEFQDKLKNDPDFAATYQLEKDIIEGIQASGNINLRNRLDQIHENKTNITSKPQTAKRISLFSKMRSLAAVVMLLIVAGTTFYLVTRKPLEERTYLAYYETPDFNTLSRSGDDLSNPLLKSAVDKFDSKDFSGSLLELNQLLQDNSNFIPAKLMKGISLMETGQFEEAASLLETIPDSSDRYDTAAWYLGLSLLRQNKLEEAKSTFSKLTNGAIPTAPKRKTKAQEILDRLNR